MKKLLRILVFCLATVSVSSLLADDSASALVKNTTEQVLKNVQQNREELEADPVKLLNLVSEYIFPAFDFNIISQWVLGEAWTKADDPTREIFTDQFRKLLVRTYATALLQFSDETIEYPEVPQKAGGRTVVVMQNVSGPNIKTIPIVYRLYRKKGEWKVFDVSVDGVSLVKTYRASFGSMIKNKGLLGLVETLSEKNRLFSQ
jgi:phospholipid transport system substrate-binding protein